MIHEQNRNSNHPEYSDFTRVETSDSPIRTFAEKLSTFVVGQEEASSAVSRAITITKAGMGDPEKPRGAFIFTGPTGVGKTEMTEALAKVMYGEAWKQHYKLINCGILTTGGDVTKLTGTSAKWIGYGDPPLVTPQFLNQPDGTIIVFDEAEKAHEEVWQALLSIIDKSTLEVALPNQNLQDASSTNKEVRIQTLRFNNAIIILTSNAGSEDIQKARSGRTGFGIKPSRPIAQTNEEVKQAALWGLKNTFSTIPELLGRIGERRIIVFNELGQDHYKEVFDKTLAEINSRISEEIYVTDTLKAWLIQEAVGSGEYGARDIKHIIYDQLVSRVAELRSINAVSPTDSLLGDLVENQIVFLKRRTFSAQESARSESSSNVTNESNTTHVNQVELKYGKPFHVEPQLKTSDFKESIQDVELLQGEKVVGKISINEALIFQSDAQLIFHPGGAIYTVTLRLQEVTQPERLGVKLRIDGQTYNGKIRQVEMQNGTVDVVVSTWENKNKTRRPIRPAFSLESLKQAAFLITN